MCSSSNFAGWKFGGSEIAHAFAPLRAKCMNTFASAIRSVAPSRTGTPVSASSRRPAAHRAPRQRFGPPPRVRFVELEDERVRPQARDVTGRVELRERIIKL